jgi:hypothetical protein
MIARSARLEPNRAPGQHQKAERPLTGKTVAQPYTPAETGISTTSADATINGS